MKNRKVSGSLFVVSYIIVSLMMKATSNNLENLKAFNYRLASSPLKTLEGHTKGVLSLAWCKGRRHILSLLCQSLMSILQVEP